MTNPPSAPRLLSRRTLTRSLGLLTTASFLLLSFAGAAAPSGLDAGTTALPDAPTVDAPATDPAATSSSDEPPQPVTPTTTKPDIRTGDKLDADEIAAFEAYVAALKEQGQHRGIAVW